MKQSRDSGISSYNGRRHLRAKGLKVNLWKTKVMVGGGITNYGMSTSEVDKC